MRFLAIEFEARCLPRLADDFASAGRKFLQRQDHAGTGLDVRLHGGKAHGAPAEASPPSTSAIGQGSFLLHAEQAGRRFEGQFDGSGVIPNLDETLWNTQTDAL